MLLMKRVHIRSVAHHSLQVFATVSLRPRLCRGSPSARRPASMIRTRTTSIGRRPPFMRSVFTVASPAIMAAVLPVVRLASRDARRRSSLLRAEIGRIHPVSQVVDEPPQETSTPLGHRARRHGWQTVASIWAMGLAVMAIVFWFTTKDDPVVAAHPRRETAPEPTAQANADYSMIQSDPKLAITLSRKDWHSAAKRR